MFHVECLAFFRHSLICLNITFDHYADPELQVANGQAEKSIIVKFVNPYETKNTVSHQRKVDSYEVESTFYEKYASKLNSARGTSLLKFWEIILMGKKMLYL